MASLTDTEVAPGQILAEKFRIERILGRGGMGVVVQAMHIHLDERVAIKFLLPEALKNPEAVRRFEREARAAVKIKSEHVARVTDVGTLSTGSPYMVMEYLNGVDLSQYLSDRGPLPTEEAIDYVLQAIEAIAEAHSLGIIHRDLKPANLFRILRPDGSPSIKVLDFGISKLGGADSSMTQTSSMLGSPYYMSPEQMTDSKTVDPRSDVWALGVILYELLSGRVPFDGDSVPEIVAKVLQNTPSPLKGSGVPAELERIVGKALSKDRDARQSDVAALAVALAPFGPAHSRTSVQRVSRMLGLTTDTTLPDGAAQRVSVSSLDVRADTTFDGAARTDLNVAGMPSKSGYRAWLGGGLALLAGALGFVAYSWQGQPPADGPSKVDALTPAAAPSAKSGGEGAPSPSAPTPTAKPSKTSPDAGPQTPAAAGQGTAKPDATAKPAPGAKPTTPAKPAAPQPRPTTTQPRPSPAAPAPTPTAPAQPSPPKPKPVDLFSDRK